MGTRSSLCPSPTFQPKRDSRRRSRQAASIASTAELYVQDRGPAILHRRERGLQRRLDLRDLLHALAVEAEMAAELLVVRTVDRHAIVQVLGGGSAVGIVMHMAHAHRLVFLVVHDDDQDRQLVLL